MIGHEHIGMNRNAMAPRSLGQTLKIEPVVPFRGKSWIAIIAPRRAG
jgi:hypothetical protein